MFDLATVTGEQIAIAAAKDRHAQTQKTLTDMLQSIEGISTEQVGAQILTLQTNLQASLQTTALLSKLSLVSFI